MIEVRGLRKEYSGHTALRDISFKVSRGEIFGIVGGSGAGKSTLLRCLNGLEAYDGGSVRVMGREVAALPPADLRGLRGRMGMVFQSFNLMSRRDVFGNVSFPLEIRGLPKEVARERVTELLRLVGLEGKSRSRPANLSGGQKQRVGIARALALNPDVLLCDEATSALDPRTTASILELLRGINERLGLTIVLVTHQMEVVKRLAGRTLLLEGGASCGLGGTAGLFLDPPASMLRLTKEEYLLPDRGVNLRVSFPRGLAGEEALSAMARALRLDFSIVGGRLERYQDRMLGFLVLNMAEEHLEAALAWLRERKLPCCVLDAPAPQAPQALQPEEDEYA